MDNNDQHSSISEDVIYYCSFFERIGILRDRVYNNIVKERKKQIDIETSDSALNEMSTIIHNSIYCIRIYTFIMIKYDCNFSSNT